MRMAVSLVLCSFRRTREKHCEAQAGKREPHHDHLNVRSNNRVGALKSVGVKRWPHSSELAGAIFRNGHQDTSAAAGRRSSRLERCRDRPIGEQCHENDDVKTPVVSSHLSLLRRSMNPAPVKVAVRVAISGDTQQAVTAPNPLQYVRMICEPRPGPWRLCGHYAAHSRTGGPSRITGRWGHGPDGFTACCVYVTY